MEKIDERVSDYNEGYKKGRKDGYDHSQPSPTTNNFINKMTEEIQEIKIKQGEQGVEISYIKERLDKFIECADEKYAPAWVAQALKVVIGTTFVIFIGAIASLILKT